MRRAALFLLTTTLLVLLSANAAEDGDAVTKRVQAIISRFQANKNLHDAVDALRNLGEQGTVSTIALLTNKDLAVRRACSTLLASLRPRNEEVIVQLALCLGNDDPETEAYIKTALQVDKDEQETVAVLTKCLDNGSLELHENAAHALGKIGRYSKNVRLLLVSKLKEKDVDPLRKKALCEGIGEIGPAAKDIIETLLEISKDKGLALHLAIAIGRVGKDAVPVLVDSLRADDQSDFLFSIFCFGLMDLNQNDNINVGTNARTIVPKLIKRLENTKDKMTIVPKSDGTDDISMRIVIIKLLGFIGKDATDAIPVLERIRDSRESGLTVLSSEFRSSAAEALKKIKE